MESLPRTICATVLLMVLALHLAQPVESEHEYTITILNKLIKNLQPDKDVVHSEQRTKQQYHSSSGSNPIGSVVPNVYSHEQPQYYQISRTYFVPVFEAGRPIIVYLPPEQLHLNPGYPIANPPRRYPGLPCVTPDNSQTDKPVTNEPTTDTDTKYGEGFPVWEQVSSTTIQPTRRTKITSRIAATHPPLVHKNTTSNSDINETPAFQLVQTKHAAGGISVRQISTPTKPSKETNTPNKCFWAVVSCCPIPPQRPSDGCFEKFGCTGASGREHPCDSTFAKETISSAVNYYNSK